MDPSEKGWTLKSWGWPAAKLWWDSDPDFFQQTGRLHQQRSNFATHCILRHSHPLYHITPSFFSTNVGWCWGIQLPSLLMFLPAVPNFDYLLSSLLLPALSSMFNHIPSPLIECLCHVIFMKSTRWPSPTLAKPTSLVLCLCCVSEEDSIGYSHLKYPMTRWP